MNSNARGSLLAFSTRHNIKVRAVVFSQTELKGVFCVNFARELYPLLFKSLLRAFTHTQSYEATNDKKLTKWSK